jgi:hypothetical protein
MCKIIILDFSAVEVHVFNYDNNIWEDALEFLAAHFNNEGMPFTENNCQWMITEENQELDIVIH